MAKKAGPERDPINKSQATRDFPAANPQVETKAVVAGLAEQGVKVAPTLVHFVRSKQSPARRRAKRKQVAVSSRQTPAENPAEVVVRVEDLGREVGGTKDLKVLVGLLADRRLGAAAGRRFPF